MSTILKSAAMTLLSKTLQTFLYKYLEDVDVEGVALPSLYTSDGSTSGWGVRLSNVKLRSGVTLMARLPGEGLSKKRKRRRRRKRAAAAAATAAATTTPSTSESIRSSKQRSIHGNTSYVDVDVDVDVHEQTTTQLLSTTAVIENSDDDYGIHEETEPIPRNLMEAAMPESTNRDLSHRSMSVLTSSTTDNNNNAFEDVDLNDSIYMESLHGHPQLNQNIKPSSLSSPDGTTTPIYYYSDDEDNNENGNDNNRSTRFLSCFSGRKSTTTTTSSAHDADHSKADQTERNVITSRDIYQMSSVHQHTLSTKDDGDDEKVQASWHGATTTTTTMEEDQQQYQNQYQYHHTHEQNQALAIEASEASDVTFTQSHHLVEQSKHDQSGRYDDATNEIVTSSYVQQQRLEQQVPEQSHYHHDDPNDDDSETEEYWEEYKQPMKLQLGDGGRIGIIDVRLVNKEIHVMIEDAELAVEIVPTDDDEDDNDDTTNNNDASPTTNNNHSGDDNATTNQTTAASTDPNHRSSSATKNKKKNATTNASSSSTSTTNKKSSQKQKQQQQQRSEAKTVGEKVMAEIALAKALSLIPHLFLRDIKIKVTIKERNGDHDDDHTDEHENANDNHDQQQRQHHDTNNHDGQYENPTDDTVFEIGIDFLSVTSSDDVLSHFQSTVNGESKDYGDDESSVPPPVNTIRSYSALEDGKMEENEYIFRHVRTGRGPSGGLWLRILPPNMKEPVSPHMIQQDRKNSLWARNRWVLDSEYFMFRCSGIDLHARIYVGTKVDGGTYSSWFYTEEDDSYAYEDSLDSVILGIDYVAPGPQLPLPPITSYAMSRGDSMEKQVNSPHQAPATDSNDFPEDFDMAEEMKKLHRPDTGIYHKDRNGIQSCNVPSCMHRVSRDMVPSKCNNHDHLPHEICKECWESTEEHTNAASPLDFYTPMPGLVMQLTIRDPIELNVDRASLESVGTLVGLFKKEKVVNDGDAQSSSQPQNDSNASGAAASNNKSQHVPTAVKTHDADANSRASTAKTAASSGYFSRLFSKKEEVVEPEDTSEAFPAYMQPEKMQMLGIHIAEIHVRVHVMRDTSSAGSGDNGLAFCYWDLDLQSLTIDRQSLSAPEKVYQENYIEAGNLRLLEFKGTDRHELLTLGSPVPLRGRCDSAASLANSIASMQEDLDQSKTPWPTTANIMLNLPPPLETLMYKSRERHALQMRHNQVRGADSEDVVRSSVNVRLGVTTLEMPFSINKTIQAARKQAMSCIFPNAEDGTLDASSKHSAHNATGSNANNGAAPNGRDYRTQNSGVESKATAKSTSTLPNIPPSLMHYKVQIDSGSICMHPLINVQLPLTQLSGEKSSETGIFLQTLLGRIGLEYGKKLQPSSKNGGNKQLSLQQLANIPDNVRMRMIMFLNDLRPLEMALGITKMTNPFKRFRAVNKAIVKLAKKQSAHFEDDEMMLLQQPTTSNASSMDRREMIRELLELNEDDLKDVMQIHKERQRRKRFGNGNDS